MKDPSVNNSREGLEEKRIAVLEELRRADRISTTLSRIVLFSTIVSASAGLATVLSPLSDKIIAVVPSIGVLIDAVVRILAPLLGFLLGYYFRGNRGAKEKAK